MSLSFPVYGRTWNLYNLKIFVFVQKGPPFNFPCGESGYSINPQNLISILSVLYKILYFLSWQKLANWVLYFIKISTLVCDFPLKAIWFSDEFGLPLPLCVSVQCLEILVFLSTYVYIFVCVCRCLSVFCR